MTTEFTDIKEFEGWVLYDAECRLCAGMARRMEKRLAARHFAVLPLQTPWVRERLALPPAELLAEMRLLKPDGRVYGGADAVLEFCRHYQLGWPIYQLGKIPALNALLHRGYRWIARRRNCAAGVCKLETAAPQNARRMHPGATLHKHADFELRISSGTRISDFGFQFLPLLGLVSLALGCRIQLCPWIFMWAMAFALYAGCKWATYWQACRRGANPGRTRSLGYLLLWPGMAAAEFFDANLIPPQPRRAEWAFAMGNTVLGFGLLWAVARRFMPGQPLLGGWIGMTGFILLVHFGLFRLASLGWHRAGVAATPVMQNPLRATALTEFWGRRWNTAFNELAFRFAYQPLRRRVPPAVATLLVFGLSGGIHELVISLPARGGYGLPAGYFLIQGLGVLTERSRWARRLGLGSGARGWWFTVLVTAGPAFWLFSPPFIHHVILPMLAAIGAT